MESNEKKPHGVGIRYGYTDESVATRWCAPNIGERNRRRIEIVTVINSSTNIFYRAWVIGMSAEDFLADIESPQLRVLLHHWLEVRGQRRMPSWHDIRPTTIKAQLPIVWSWKYDRASDKFTGRLAGERIQAVFATNIRGAAMSDVFSGHDYARMFARHKRVLSEPAFFRGRGLVFRHLDRFDAGERIILPLAGDGSNGDGIIGATDFQSNLGAVPDDVLRVGEIEEWFAID